MVAIPEQRSDDGGNGVDGGDDGGEGGRGASGGSKISIREGDPGSLAQYVEKGSVQMQQSRGRRRRARRKAH